MDARFASMRSRSYLLPPQQVQIQLGGCPLHVCLPSCATHLPHPITCRILFHLSRVQASKTSSTWHTSWTNNPTSKFLPTLQEQSVFRLRPSRRHFLRLYVDSWRNIRLDGEGIRHSLRRVGDKLYDLLCRLKPLRCVHLHTGWETCATEMAGETVWFIFSLLLLLDVVW